VLVHATGDGAIAVNTLARRRFDDLLAEAPQEDATPGDIRVLREQGDDVAPRRFGVVTEDQVR
jgi:hypothetical protein